MKKWCGILFALLAIGGCAAESRGGGSRATGKTFQSVLINLIPETSAYTVDEVSRGAVRFSARVENKGDRSITFAHPAVCFPADRPIDRSLNFADFHGKLEILLTVKKPDGQVVVLRDGPHFFDPGGVSHFIIPPGESIRFYVGWFFQNARGRWEDDLTAERAFTEQGPYRVTLLYRNFFQKAFVYDASSGKSNLIPVWTGEIRSNEVAVKIAGEAF